MGLVNAALGAPTGGVVMPAGALPGMVGFVSAGSANAGSVNPGVGDALMFRIAPQYEHRIADVTGQEPRTAFAGWFCSEPEYLPGVRSTGSRTADMKTHEASE